MKEYTTGALYLPENTTRQARAYLDEQNPKHSPSLWFVVGNHDETTQLIEVCGDIIHEDPYDLLDTARNEPTREKMKGLLTHTRPFSLTREVLGVAIFTTGWASPLPADFDGDESSLARPSQHPERRRVEVLAFEGWGGASACVRFGDDKENDLNGSGGVGTLADELSGLWDFLVRDTAISSSAVAVCYFCGAMRPIGAALHQIRTCPTPSVSAEIKHRFICETCERGQDD